MVRVIKTDGEAQEKDINKIFHIAMEEVLGTKIIYSEKIPLLYFWVTKLNDLALVKETIATNEKLVSILKVVRDKALKTCDP
ncbi:hypothetical protein REPUB_Repub01dG0053700 [Reevesia pubescens]